MNDVVFTEKQGAVLEVILNRPDKKNALTLSMYQVLTQTLSMAMNDPEVNVVLLRAEGDSFSAGNDIQDFISSAHNPQAIDIIVGFLHALVDCEKPIVAAVNGDAVGIGTTMLLHCDIVVAANDLRCKMPFVKLGLIPEGGSTLLIPSLLGHQKAFELMVEGKGFGAEEGQVMGMVNQVVSRDGLLDQARDRAQALSLLPPNSVQISKALMKKPYIKELHRTLDEEGRLFYKRLSSPEAKAAFMKFLQASA